MTSLPPVVQATVDGHKVVAVRCSNVPNKPWLAVEVGKGWTTARADAELEEKVALGPVAASRRTETVTVTNREKVVTGGRAPVGVFEAMGLPGFSGSAPDAFFTTLLKGPSEDLWCVRSAILPGDGFEGTAVEVWARMVKIVDDAWTVESIEQSVDGTWRQRSLRDLLEAAGGDPL